MKQVKTGLKILKHLFKCFAGLEWKDRFSRGQEQKIGVPGRRSSGTRDLEFWH